jgi:hypothetical protein
MPIPGIVERLERKKLSSSSDKGLNAKTKLEQQKVERLLQLFEFWGVCFVEDENVRDDLRSHCPMRDSAFTLSSRRCSALIYERTCSRFTIFSFLHCCQAIQHNLRYESKTYIVESLLQ